MCTQLSTDALAVQQMIGTRMGVICEALALFWFGLLLGISFSWQLTMIVLGPLLLLTVCIYWNVRLDKWLYQQSGFHIGRASTVR